MKDRTPMEPSRPGDDDWNRVIKGTAEDKKREKRVERKVEGRDGIGHVLFVLIMILIALAAIAAVLLSIRAIQSKNVRSEPTATHTTSAPVSRFSDGQGGTNPASDASISYSPASSKSDVSVNQRSVMVKGESITTTLDMPKLQGAISGQPCQLGEDASCYLGSAKYDNQNVDIFALSDASASSLLLSSEKIQKVDVQGAALAYTQQRTLDGKPTNTLIVVNLDQTAIMVIGQPKMAALADGLSINSDSSRTK